MIAERLDQLRESKRKNNDNDDDDKDDYNPPPPSAPLPFVSLPYYPSSSSIDDEEAILKTI